MSPEFLSPEWFEQLADRLADCPPSPEGSAIRIKQVVSQTPSGEDASWAIRFEPGESPRLDDDPGSEADVTLRADYGALRQLASGEVTAADLLAAGEIKLAGDVSRLLGSATLLESVTAALAAGSL